MTFQESVVVGLVAAVTLFVPVFSVLRSDERLVAKRDVRVLAGAISLPLAATVAVVWPVEFGVANADTALTSIVVGVYVVLAIASWGLAAYVRATDDDG